MSFVESYDDLVTRAAELFLETDEPVYWATRDYPKPYPITYAPYDLGTAAFEALLELEPGILRSSPLELIAKRQQIEENLQEIIPDWQEISRARNLAALVLSNYSGSGLSFCPN